MSLGSEVRPRIKLPPLGGVRGMAKAGIPTKEVCYGADRIGHGRMEIGVCLRCLSILGGHKLFLRR